MDYPSWITPPNLGSYSQDYSFNLNPIIIQFSAGQGSIVTQINGSLPTGMSWEQSGQIIQILGITTQTSSDIEVRITFRITQTNGAIADRTYFILLTDIPVPPSWEFQNTLLGYQSNTLPKSYQMHASVPEGQHVTYSIISPGIAGNVNVATSIGESTGFLTCDASNVLVNSTVTIGVQASTTISSDIEVYVEVVVDTTAPQWMTPTGTLGTFSGSEFIDLTLLAEDPNGFQVTYALSSNPDGAPIQISSSGLLYGRLPNVLAETIYSIIASATNGTLTSFRTFTITAVPSTDTSLLVWETPSDLGPIDEGQEVKLSVKAVTRRQNTTIIYSMTGGVVPPYLQLGTTNGLLTGFCEYVAIPKTYYFNITANDGFQVIERQFTINVRKVYGDQFFTLGIPLAGGLKAVWITDSGNIRVRVPQTNTYNQLQDINYHPSLIIINGVVTNSETANELVRESSDWLYELNLQFGEVSNTAIVEGQTVVFRGIDDFQQGTNAIVYSSAVYNTNVQTDGLVYPISIDNIRDSISLTHSYVNAGGGSGGILSPTINWSTGELLSVMVANTGSGYTSPPTVSVSGSGTGASVRAVLGVVSIEIMNSGQGWSVNDEIELFIGRYLRPARITVIEIGTNGSVVNFRIDDAGDYLQIPYVVDNTIGSGSKTAQIAITYGISAAIVLSGGSNYQGGISFSTVGTEILPWWQETYSPEIYIGNIAGTSGTSVSEALDTENSFNRLIGYNWHPDYFVFQWQGLRWNGTTTFDDELTTFDGDTTRFEETSVPAETIFGQGNVSIDTDSIFNQDLYYVNGSVEPLDMHATLFDIPSTIMESRTLVRLWVNRINKIYSPNNAVW